MYVIAALQFGTVFVLAAIFWANPIIEHLKRMRAARKPRPVSAASDYPTSASNLVLASQELQHRLLSGASRQVGGENSRLGCGSHRRRTSAVRDRYCRSNDSRRDDQQSLAWT
jgi:hypothetical protein